MTLERETVYSYRACGLNIESDLRLPELDIGHEPRFSSGGADVVIRFDRLERFSHLARQQARHIRPTPEGIHLFWRDTGAFLVRDGREIVVDPIPGVREPLLRLFLLGTTMAMLLHQRGEVVVLHGSVVAGAGQAVAFLGNKGAGKSTLAAAMHARGHDLLSDDILAIDVRGESVMAVPSFPHLKLWPDSATSIGYAPEDMPRLRPELEKRGYHPSTGFVTMPMPLKQIYVLDVAAELAEKIMSSRDASLALMQNWYGARFGAEVLRTLGLSAHFRQCAELASRVQVCYLQRPLDFNALDDLVRLVEDNLNA